MPHIVLFHSILGLRAIEHDLAAEWEAAGHTTSVPDLFAGRATEDYEQGAENFREVGGAAVLDRARAAAEAAPADSVLAGVSMGAGKVGDMWSERPSMRGALLIAGACDWGNGPRAGLPVQAHISKPDPFDDEDFFADWEASNPGVALDLRRYANGGHYFLDPALPDFQADAATEARAAMIEFLARL